MSKYKNIIYVKDKDMYYDPQSKGGPSLIKQETALKRLAAYDEKFEDRSTALKELLAATECGVNYDDIVSSKRSSKQINYAEIYEAMRPLFPIMFRKTASGQSLAYIISEDREVTKIEYQTEENLRDALMFPKQQHLWAAIRQFYNSSELLEGHRDKLHFGPFIMSMIKNWLLYDERQVMEDEPTHISWDESEYAYKKMNPKLLVPGPTPTWDEFLTRLDYPEVFMAWVWSIFEPTNNIRQIMWLRGAGSDGKSSVQKAIEGVIGKEYCYSMKENDEQKQWFQKNVYTKVLVNYADCKNMFLVQNSAIKQLTGGDTTSIEGKGENAFTGKIYSKVFVTSNILPKIDPELRAHTSRIIKLEVMPQAEAKKDSKFEERLQEEIYPFLYKCSQAFTKYASPGGERLILPDNLYERILTECASESHMHIMDFVEAKIEFGDDFHCKSSDLNRSLRDFLVLEKHLQSSMVRYYEEEFKRKVDSMGCTQRRVEVEGRLQTVFIGFRIKNAVSEKQVG